MKHLAVCVAQLLLLSSAMCANSRLELNTLTVLRGVFHAEPGSQCAAMEVQLDHATEHAVLCPNASGHASFALPLHFPTAGSSRLGRVAVSQPGAAGGATHIWQRFVDTAHMLHIDIDMRQGEEAAYTAATVPALGPAVPDQPSATHHLTDSSSTQLAAGCACCTRSWIELEDFGDRSLPTFLALASSSAPTCQAPTAHSPPLPPVLSCTSTHQPAGKSLLLGLWAVCILQALALAGLLSRRLSPGAAAGGKQPELAASAAGDSQEHTTAAAPACRPRPSQRDACTSPMVAMLLASPFVRSKAAVADAAAALQPIEEEQQAQQAQQKTAHQAAHQAEKQQSSESEGGEEEEEGRQLHQDRRGHKAAPPPSDWTRDGWGRLQRQPGQRDGAGGSGGRRWGAKAGRAFAVQHPPPFGSAPGTAYRYAFEE